MVRLRCSGQMDGAPRISSIVANGTDRVLAYNTTDDETKPEKRDDTLAHHSVEALLPRRTAVNREALLPRICTHPPPKRVTPLTSPSRSQTVGRISPHSSHESNNTIAPHRLSAAGPIAVVSGTAVVALHARVGAQAGRYLPICESLPVGSLFISLCFGGLWCLRSIAVFC